jgi:pantetheine-phosphate adenylyltransferase
MAHALLPGTFDPPTLGHLDLMRRAAALFGRVTVALAVHPTKTALFSAEERLELLRRIALDAGLSKSVAVARIEGLSVQAALELGATVLVRGVRHGSDLDYEQELARTNRLLAPALDTVLLVPSPEVGHVSSTLVRQIAAMGGDVSGLVPPAVLLALKARGER